MSATRPIAVVTGASAGVGRATARLFAVRGYDVALLARGAEGLAAAQRDVEDVGGRALTVTADVACYEDVDSAATQVENELGPIQVWINDAMTTVFAPLSDIAPDEFRRAVEVTFLGQVWGTKVALARMRPRDEGTIVNVGSALAFIGIPLQSPYCSAKFACRGFFESVRAELLHDRSRVTMSMVHLPAVNTPQFEWSRTVFRKHPQPVAPIYQPEICAQAIVAAALTGRRERVLGSWNKLLVIGARAMPGVGNQFAAKGAWEEQLADRPIQDGRQPNLFAPVDQFDDFGAHGTFGDRAGGFWTPSFLVTLPHAARELGRAAIAAGRERWASRGTGRPVDPPFEGFRPGGSTEEAPRGTGIDAMA